MKWEADQRVGFFGWTAGHPPQMRWRQRVDIDMALNQVGDILERWWTMLAWPSAPPFTGGVLDSWPARLTDGLALCRSEWAAIQAFLRWEADEAARKREAQRG